MDDSLQEANNCFVGLFSFCCHRLL